MWTAALLACATLPLQEPEAPEMVTLTSYRMLGRDVPAKVPAIPGPFQDESRTITHNGWKYYFTPEGGLARRYKAQGGWSEIRELYAEAKAKFTESTPVWRTKVFILTRGDVLDRGSDGLLRVRRGRLEGRALNEALESIARFGAMAEAYSEGAIRMAFDVELDGDWTTIEPDQGPQQLPSSLHANYVPPRVNDGGYEAEDRVYRGPYDSVIAVHPTPAFRQQRPPVVGPAISVISTAVDGAPRGWNGLTNALFNNWLTHVRWAHARLGSPLNEMGFAWRYGLAEDVRQGLYGFEEPMALFLRESLAKLVAEREPTGSQLLRRMAIQARVEPVRWREVSDDPLGKLPRLNWDDLSKRFGQPLEKPNSLGPPAIVIGGQVNARGGSVGEFDAILHSHEGIAYAQVGDRGLFLIAAEFADLVADKLGDGTHVLGYIEAFPRVAVVFEGPTVSAETEAGLFGLSGTPRRTFGESITYRPADDEGKSVVTAGAFFSAMVDDGEAGSVLEIRTRGFPRAGKTWLIGERYGRAIADRARHRYLSIRIKATNPEPLVLYVFGYGPGGFPNWNLFGSVTDPPTTPNSGRIDLPADGLWRQIIVDLNSPTRPNTLASISTVALYSDPSAPFWEATQQGAEPVIRIAEVTLSAEPPGPLTPFIELPEPKAAHDSETPLERARYIARLGQTPTSEELSRAVALLKDPKDVVRLNACALFTRVLHPDAVPGLIDNLSSLDHRVAEQAAKALAHQGTQAALDALKRALETGPFDTTRQSAAEAIADRADPKFIAALSVLYSSPSWRTRRAAAEALGKIKTREAATVLMVFLQEEDPAVRLAVIRAADPTHELVGRRLLWTAVNDPSDLVRAESYMKLLLAPSPALSAEGAKGVRDDSKAVRLWILERLRSAPTEAGRPALRLAVTDESPVVRAAALRAFAVIPGPVSLEEVQNCALDIDPRVASAFDELAKAKGIKRPDPGTPPPLGIVESAMAGTACAVQYRGILVSVASRSEPRQSSREERTLFAGTLSGATARDR